MSRRYHRSPSPDTLDCGLAAISRATRRLVREAAYGVPERREYHVPVLVVAGDGEPSLAGSAGYHTTPSGRTIVRHPGAYGYRTLYHCSTRHIEVGLGWLQARGLAATPLACTATARATSTCQAVAA